MNLTKLFEMQRVLDERIVKEKGLEGQDLLSDKILALQVELGECANEWRGFKFWSNRKEPKMFPLERCSYCGEEVSYTRPSPFMADHNADMCEECWNATKQEYAASDGGYIPEFKDYPHFPDKKPQKLLEEYIDCLHFILSIGLAIEIDTIEFGFVAVVRDTTNETFLAVFKKINEFWNEPDDWNYEQLMNMFSGLGKMLGFTWEQIEEAYKAKWAINHQRQSNGY